MNYTENESWIIEAGDRVIEKKARLGASQLTDWEQLVYCVWVADYMMRNAGDFANAGDLMPTFQQDGARLAASLALPATSETFALPQERLQAEYLARFEAVCGELRHAGRDPG